MLISISIFIPAERQECPACGITIAMNFIHMQSSAARSAAKPQLLAGLVLSLVATGPGFNVGAQAQAPAPAQPSAAATPAAVPAEAAVTPARRTSFKEVTSQLDPGGSVFVYLATDQWLAGLSTNVARLRDVIQNLPNVPPAVQEQLNLVFKLLIDAIPRTGIEGVSGLGVSGVQITQELHRSKLVVHHNAGQGQGLLWNLFGGQAHRLRALDMLPRTTALAVFGDLDIMQVWKFVERTVSDSGDSGLANGLREWQRGLEQGASLSWTNLLASFGGEAGIILTLDDSRRLTLPVGPRPIDLPEPGLIIALKINDDTLYDRISQQLKANPQTEVKEEAGLKMCVMPLGLPLPMPVQLSVASSGDYFFAATAPELIRAVLDARSGKAPGLAQSPRFKALRQYLPAEGNQFFFVDKRFSESLRAIQKQAMESNPSAGGQAAFLEALLFSKPAAFGLAVGGHTPARLGSGFGGQPRFLGHPAAGPGHWRHRCAGGHAPAGPGQSQEPRAEPQLCQQPQDDRRGLQNLGLGQRRPIPLQRLDQQGRHAGILRPRRQRLRPELLQALPGHVQRVCPSQ